MRYTFGDTITANERLKRISDFFNPLAKEFITQHVQDEIGLAADLGCGPGYTTNMLATATQARSVVGIDISNDFVEFARNEFPDYTFIKHDVRVVPFPFKSDLIYFRFLLSHLINIRRLIESWLTLLNPGGNIIIDETEDIYTEMEVFRTYLKMSDGLIATQKAQLFVGKILEKELSGLNIKCNESTLIPVQDWQAATWFYPNTVSVWEDEDWIKNQLTNSQRKKISEELFAISNEKKNISNITWRMRRMIIHN